MMSVTTIERKRRPTNNPLRRQSAASVGDDGECGDGDDGRPFLLYDVVVDGDGR